MNKLVMLCVCFFSLSFPGFSFSVAQEGNIDLSEVDAKNFVQELANKAINVISKKEISVNEAEKQFDKLLTDYFAVKNIATFSLGKYYRQLTEEQKEIYVKSFQQMTVRSYTMQFLLYKSAKINVLSAKLKSVRKSQKQYLVTSEILIPDEAGKTKNIQALWSLYSIKGKLKVFDVIVDGISMSKIQKDVVLPKIQKTAISQKIKLNQSETLNQQVLAKFIEEFSKEYN